MKGEQAYQEERLHLILPLYAHPWDVPSFLFIMAHSIATTCSDVVGLERRIDVPDPQVTAN